MAELPGSPRVQTGAAHLQRSTTWSPPTQSHIPSFLLILFITVVTHKMSAPSAKA